MRLRSNKSTLEKCQMVMASKSCKVVLDRLPIEILNKYSAKPSEPRADLSCHFKQMDMNTIAIKIKRKSVADCDDEIAIVSNTSNPRKKLRTYEPKTNAKERSIGNEH